MNIVTLVGRLTAKAELKAVGENKQAVNGQIQLTSFHSLLAELLQKFLLTTQLKDHWLVLKVSFVLALTKKTVKLTT